MTRTPYSECTVVDLLYFLLVIVDKHFERNAETGRTKSAESSHTAPAAHALRLPHALAKKGRATGLQKTSSCKSPTPINLICVRVC